MTDTASPPPSSPLSGLQPALAKPAPKPKPTPEQMAQSAVKTPLSPELGARCPRCGQRLPKPGDAPPAAAPAASAPAPALAASPSALVVPDAAKDAGKTTCTRCKVDPLSAEAGLLLAPTSSWIWEMVRGALYVPRGFFRVVLSPSLWKWAVVPLILNILVVILAFVLAGSLSDWLQSKTGAGALRTWEDAGGLWWALSYVVWGLGWLASKLAWVVIPLLCTWLMVAFPFSILYKALFMPFMELMTEATERIVLRFDEDAPMDFAKIYANLVVAIVDAILLTLTQGLLYLLLLPINIIPLLGNFLWMVLPPAIFAGMDYTDINLVRRGYTMREKVRLWHAHEWRFLGYGMAFFFFLTIPVLNAFVIPAAAVGGALLYLELPRK